MVKARRQLVLLLCTSAKQGDVVSLFLLFLFSHLHRRRDREQSTATQRGMKGKYCVREGTLSCQVAAVKCGSAFRSFFTSSNNKILSFSAALTWPVTDHSPRCGSFGPAPTDACCFDSVIMMEQRPEPVMKAQDRVCFTACCCYCRG